MRKSVITTEEKNKWWNGTLFEDDVVELAIGKAYRDLMRTIRGFASNKNNNVIKTNARESIKKYIDYIVECNMNQELFDKLHREQCYKLIEIFGEQEFTIGQAQKWINMTFKNLHLLEYSKIDAVYEYCHIPIDSYMLSITKYSKLNTSWSKLDNYDDYLEYQKWFREKYNDEIPLDKEFYLWLEESEKRSKLM